MKTGAELKARRLELGITQHDLAGNAGISRTQLSRMENGHIEIPIEIRPILCDLLYTKQESRSGLTINDINKSMKKEDYLKMNEKEDVSFYDLIDAAVQAKKDGVCESVEIDINNWLIVKSSIGNIHCHKNHLIPDNEFHINWIKSLYTEEFVIETMADELRVKSGAELTLSNGINCVYFDDGDKKLRYDGDFYPCNFLILKGATVKQSKGELK